jgi:uncharacterized protein (TIGR03435 family)
MLEEARGQVSEDLARRVLAATAQKGGSFPTLYSNVYDLRARTMHLYYFRDFERRITFDLDEELPKGARVLDIPALFPPNAAAEKFAARQPGTGPSPWWIFDIVISVTLVVAVLGALYLVIRGTRRVRFAVLGGAAAAALGIALTAVTLYRHPRPSPLWSEFSVGPAFGTSTWIGSSGLRSSGAPLRTILSAAYGVPSLRIVTPAWMTDTRYAVTAVLPADAPDTFRFLLQQELANRLGLKAHLETRPFDVFVLSATDPPRLSRVDGNAVSISVHESGLFAQEATMANLANALQGVLGSPVVDETGLAGNYEIELEWTEDKVGSLTASLRNNFGLQLTPARRDLDALVVDEIHRDAGLVLLAQVTRLTSGAPEELRRRIADLLSVR